MPEETLKKSKTSWFSMNALGYGILSCITKAKKSPPAQRESRGLTAIRLYQIREDSRWVEVGS